MPDNTLLNILIGVAIAAALAYYFYATRDKQPPAKSMAAGGSNGLQLQAYERLTLLVDRIAIPNLISRNSYEGLSAREMQMMLTKAIRDEFDFNITQQIYITPDTWQAVKNLKETNLLIINQVASILPPNATGLDLNKSLLQFLMNDNKGNLHELVSQALSYEAKKLL